MHGNKQELNEIKAKILGKKGELTAILKSMGGLTPEERPVIGGLVNKVRDKLEDLIQNEKIDITLPASKIKKGSKHPVNRVIEEIEDLFVSMGYDVISGPELETDEFCFERLNLPKGHPARDMQDSFYITNEYLLRTQTSSVQARTMLKYGGDKPIRMICTGKTYRREDDATHSHQFNQVEGLVIDKKENHVSLADLKGTLEVFVRKLLGENERTSVKLTVSDKYKNIFKKIKSNYHRRYLSHYTSILSYYIIKAQKEQGFFVN